ncbi:MAG: D-alanine--D-alanine ligase [Myxococcales bacterium]|nr:D-alanine--D-alanine ligase [Myxococcales bacterium]
MSWPNRGGRVGVVMGGWSGEHEVSLKTGNAVADALSRRGHDVVRVVVPKGVRGPARGLDLLNALVRARIDVAFLALHGRMGEDGCVQGLLEIAGVPYTGSGVTASALAMDKVKSKELFLLHNVPTPPYYTVSVDDDLADIESLHRTFGFPAVVKPRGEGSSLGVSRVSSLGELARALETVFALDDHAIVERYVEAAEVNVAILDGRALGAIEICPKGGGLYDYHAKYTPGATDYHMPARLPPARYQNILNLALAAGESLGVSGAARVDLLVTRGENEYVLEVNTLPGMTETSLLPKIARHAGYAFEDLCETILAGAKLHVPLDRDISPVRRSGTVLRALHVVQVPELKAV